MRRFLPIIRIGIVVFLCVIVLVLLNINRKQREELLRLQEASCKTAIEDQLKGLRIPYETVLFDTKDFHEVAEYYARKAHDSGVDTIAPYSAVLQDDVCECKATDSGTFWNASVALHDLNAFSYCCGDIQRQIREKRGAIYDALLQRDPAPRNAIRSHLRRALKTKYNELALPACATWLAVYEPIPEVREQLERMASLPKFSDDDYSSLVIMAVQLIDAYHLDVSYPDDVKQSRAYQEKMRPLRLTKSLSLSADRETLKPR